MHIVLAREKKEQRVSSVRSSTLGMACVEGVHGDKMMTTSGDTWAEGGHSAHAACEKIGIPGIKGLGGRDDQIWAEAT